MKRKTGLYYKETAFRLFDELSEIYAEDIDKHADLCRRYPKIAHKYIQWSEKSMKNIKIPDEIDVEESKKKVWQRLQFYVKA